MARGDHVLVRRRPRYTHHGIDCGDGTVIHYVGRRGTQRVIDRTSIAEFARGGEVLVRRVEPGQDPEATVRRAESRIGTREYHLLRNNCEHFAAWCATGRASSTQVRRWAVAGHGTIASLAGSQLVGAHVGLVALIGFAVYAMRHPRA